MTVGHGDEPSAVLRVRVLVWVVGGEDGAVWSSHIVATGSCVEMQALLDRDCITNLSEYCLETKHEKELRTPNEFSTNLQSSL